MKENQEKNKWKGEECQAIFKINSNLSRQRFSFLVNELWQPLNGFERLERENFSLVWSVDNIYSVHCFFYVDYFSRKLFIKPSGASARRKWMSWRCATSPEWNFKLFTPQLETFELREKSNSFCSGFVPTMGIEIEVTKWNFKVSNHCSETLV